MAKKERIIVTAKELETFRSMKRLKSTRDAEIVLRTMHAGKKVSFI